MNRQRLVENIADSIINGTLKWVVTEIFKDEILGEKDFSNVRLGSNSLIRDKISFVGAQVKDTPVAHGSRSCSWARYR